MARASAAWGDRTSRDDDEMIMRELETASGSTRRANPNLALIDFIPRHQRDHEPLFLGFICTCEVIN